MNTVAISDRRPNLQVAIVFAALAIVAILAYRQVARASTIPVWTAAQALRPGSILGPESLTQTRMRKKTLPVGALIERQSIEGQKLAGAKAPGHPFFAHDFAAPTRPPVTPLAAHIPEGRVLTTLSIEPTAIPYPQLRYGDRLEIVAVHGMGTGNGLVVARDAFMVGSLAPSPTRVAASKKGALGVDLSPPRREAKGGAKGFALLLALHPRDVLSLAEAEGGNAQLKLVLHGKNEVDRGTLLNLEAPAPTVVELISGAEREQVTLLP